jgi:hypothetical protein
MRKALHTTKITLKALRSLSLISAITGEKRYEVQERLFQQEVERLVPALVEEQARQEPQARDAAEME